MQIDKEYMLKEIHAFRAIMGSTEYSVEQVGTALEGLWLVYLNYTAENDKDKVLIEDFILATTSEYDTRMGYRLALDILNKGYDERDGV